MAFFGASEHKKIVLQEPYDCAVNSSRGVVSFRSKVLKADKKGIYINDSSGLSGAELKGKAIRIRYYRKNGAFEYLSKIINVVSSPQAKLLYLTLPDKVKRIERRRFPRKDAKGTLSIQLSNHIGGTASGSLKSLSLGGIRFTTMKAGIFSANSKPVGQTLTVKVLDGVLKGQSFDGKVVGAQIDATMRDIVIVRFAFLKLDPVVKDQIARLTRF